VNGPALSVRLATDADRPGIEEMLKESWLSDEDAARALSTLDGPSVRAVIALSGNEGTVVGLGVLRIDAGTDDALIANVVHLAVRRTMRGRGVGAALLEGLRREAVATRCRELRVATRSRPTP
jgi:N-acetylglutamate synthase-like GNAT family acetyltransferase